MPSQPDLVRVSKGRAHFKASVSGGWTVVLALFCEYIALARQAQIYRNISDPLGRLATLHCNALLNNIK